MADNDTMLGYLAPWLSERIEDIAVEALGYILKRYDTARAALDSSVASGVKDVNPVCEVETQVIFDDWSRVDLVGIDKSCTKHVLIEAKFWAELTHRQPNDYLNNLPTSGPSVLLFLAPKERIDILWHDLRSRAALAHITLSDVSGESKCTRVNDTERHLMLISWESLLDSMATSASDPNAVADIRQLRGLADQASTAPEPEIVFKRIVTKPSTAGLGMNGPTRQA